MIPHIIHYCWFGRKEKPKEVTAFIDAWKKKLPDYTFMEWNEDNFDVDTFIYTKEAYEKGKYAFVSDVARLCALKQYGGVYLDTDIEIKRDFSGLLEKYDLVLGYEAAGDHLMTAFIAASKGNEHISRFMDLYKNERFVKDDGSFNTYPNTYRLTEFLRQDSIKIDGNFQLAYENKAAIFPETAFSAMEFSTMTEISDDTTYTVHHFKSSWKPWYVRLRRKIKMLLIKKFKVKIFS